jgi:hypothetical protein
VLHLGIGLPDEEDGLIPIQPGTINQAESWSSGDTYISSVGQGYVLLPQFKFSFRRRLSPMTAIYAADINA